MCVSKEAIQRSAREIASTGFFDPEKVNPDIKPNYEDGTVDINWELEQKSNDQLEFSLGWGQTGIIGRIGIKLNNFSMRNLFGKNKMHRGIMPIGDGEQLSLSYQSNGSYYNSISTGYSTGWFGGKRPNAFNISIFYSKQSDISSTYRNSAWMNNYYNYYGGYGSYNSGYYDYTSMMDEDKYIKLFGVSVGWGKRLRWPDDYFQLSTQLSYTRYMLRDWSYFLISNGNCNNIVVQNSWPLSPLRHPGHCSTRRTMPIWLLRRHTTRTLTATMTSCRRNTVGLSTTSGSSRQDHSRHSLVARSVWC